MDGSGIHDDRSSVNSHQLQQQELVSFLYQRFRFGFFITLFVALVGSTMAYVELEIQGREQWVLGWCALLAVVIALRWRVLRRFFALKDRSYFHYQYWHRCFYVGAVMTGLMLGGGAALLMPYITANVQIILHAGLLAMCAGAIAYLSTSFRIYIAYMVTMMGPVTIWLFLQEESVSIVLSSLYLFFMIAGWISVRRMNELVNDALYYRYDNEALIDDLQRLLDSVSQSNKALEKISTTDELTGVSNYRSFRVQLEEAWRQFQSNDLPLSMIKVNIDRFDEYNVRHGQEAGDSALREIAGMLSDQATHQGQVVARLQGAEFALLLPGTSCENARQLAQSIMRRVGERFSSAEGGAELTLSVGLGCQSVSPDSASRELLVRVDTALKLAKERGRNRLEVIEG